MKSHLVFFFTLLSLITPHNVSASPAYPRKIQVRASTGVWVKISLHGDEYFSYGLSEDGYSLIQEDGTWYYAQLGDSGNLVPSQHTLMPYDQETENLQQFKSGTPKHILPTQSNIQEHRSLRNRIKRRSNSPIVGKRRSLVILMQFADVSMTLSRDDFECLFNEKGYSYDGAKGSVRDYFEFVSDGQLDYYSDIFGPYTTQNKMSFYGGNNKYSQDSNPVEMAVEALRSLPDSLDLSIYDYNNDGYVDNVHIIYAGYGEEAGASSNAIWAHEYPHTLPLKINGMGFASYSCSPELRTNSGHSISRIGVHCHEMMHALGAMDYYDTNYETGGEYVGTGNWDLMASGSWNNDGISPSKPNPYIRAYDMGWITVSTLSQTANYTLETDQIIRIETGSNNDYYLLENRQQTHFDSYLPGSGLMIYHHHPNHENLLSSNDINATHPQCFYPVCASASVKSPLYSRNYGNINDRGCAFPFNGKFGFSTETTPSAFAWNNTTADFELSNIRHENGIIAFSASINGESVDEEPIATKATYSESFENGLSEYDKDIIYGTAGWSIYPGSGFFSETELIPSAYDGKRLLVLFTGNKGQPTGAELKSQQIPLSVDSVYTFSFYYQSCFAPTSSTPPTLTVELKGNNGTETQIFSIDDNVESWRQYKVELARGTNSLYYSLVGDIKTGGIFIDYIQLNGTPISAGIDIPQIDNKLNVSVSEGMLVLSSEHPTRCSIYSQAGILAHPTSEVNAIPQRIQLPHGVYIIKSNSDKKVIVI